MSNKEKEKEMSFEQPPPDRSQTMPPSATATPVHLDPKVLEKQVADLKAQVAEFQGLEQQMAQRAKVAEDNELVLQSALEQLLKLVTGVPINQGDLQTYKKLATTDLTAPLRTTPPAA